MLDWLYNLYQRAFSKPEKEEVKPIQYVMSNDELEREMQLRREAAMNDFPRSNKEIEYGYLRDDVMKKILDAADADQKRLEEKFGAYWI